MRYLFLLFLFFSCRDAEPSADNKRIDSLPDKKDSTIEIANDLLIVPGISIGKINIGTNAASLEETLGPPALSDAAMGKAWLTWNGKRDEHNNQTELNIFTSYKDEKMDEKIVRLIRTTSQEFSTQANIHVYSSIEQIKKAYPEVEQSLRYQHQDKRYITIHEAKQQGIAFELSNAGQQKICIGIIVYEKGSNLADIYRTLQPGLKTSF
jgi:hypothetical protein